MGFPPWVIGIIIIVLIISLSSTVYFVFRKKIGRNRAAVGAQQDEEAVLEKSITNPTTYPAITPLYNIASSENSSRISSKHGLHSNQSTSTIPTTVPSSPYTTPSAKSIDDKKSTRDNNTRTASPTATLKDDSFMEDEPSFPESPKINLPLPPPSSSFFADKMELDSIEAHDLYQAYLSASQDVDLDEGSKLSLSNIQQKAANFRTSIYQSLRRKSIYNKSPPLGQFLDVMNSSNSSIKSPTKSPVEMSRQSSSSTRFTKQQHQFLPPSPRPDSPATSENSSKKSLVRATQVQDEDEPNSNKIMIDTLPHESYFSLPMTPVTPSPIGKKPALPSSGLHVTTDLVDDINNQFNNDTEEESEEGEDKPRDSEEDKSEEDMDSAQMAASAARKCIRSASRKSKTLSMIITDEDAQAMFTSLMNNNGESMPSAPPDITKYATVRSKPVLEKIDTEPNVMDIKAWSSSNVGSGTDTVSGKKSIRIKNQLKNIFGQDDDDVETSKKSSPSTTPALKDLFSPPPTKENDKESIVNRPVSIITTSSDANKTSSTPIESSSPYSSKNNTLNNNSSNMDTIRKMLQTSWSGSSIKESLSNNSLTSGSNRSSAYMGSVKDSSGSNRSSAYMGSVGSSYRSGSINPRLQNQQLISKSLMNNTSSQFAARARPSMPTGFMHEEEEGPEPTVSFSTSTVLTMIPAEEEEQQQKKPVKQTTKKSVWSRPMKVGGGAGKTPAQMEREKYLKNH